MKLDKDQVEKIEDQINSSDFECISNLELNKYSNYICFDKVDGNGDVSIFTGDKNFVSWAKDNGISNIDGMENYDFLENEDKLEEGELSSEIALLLIKSRISISSYFVVSDALYPLMPSLRRAYSKGVILTNSKKHFNRYVCNNNNAEVFGVNESKSYLIRRQIRKLRELDDSLKIVPNSIFMGLVSSYDSIVEKLARILLVNVPNKVENSNKSFTVKEILSFSDFGELKDKLINDEIESLMRGSHLDQVRFFEQYLGIEISKNYVRWSKFMEIFERRNLAAHGDLTVNKIYINNCNKIGFPTKKLNIGERLNISKGYFDESVSIILEFVFLLIFSVWRKLDESKLVEHIDIFADQTYEMLVDRNYICSNWILEFLVNGNRLKIDQRLKSMMTINLSISYKKLGKDKECAKSLSSIDWSTYSDEYLICVAAIRENLDDVVRLLPIAASSNKITSSDIYSWMAFDWVRNLEPFKCAFEQVFGEALVADGGGDSFAVKYMMDG